MPRERYDCFEGNNLQTLTRVLRPAVFAEYRSPDPSNWQYTTIVERGSREVCEDTCPVWWCITVHALGKIRAITAGDNLPVVPLPRSQIESRTAPTGSDGALNWTWAGGFESSRPGSVLWVRLRLQDSTGRAVLRWVDVGHGFTLFWFGRAAAVDLISGAPPSVGVLSEPQTFVGTAASSGGTFQSLTSDFYEDAIIQANVRPTDTPHSHARTSMLWTFVRWDPGPEVVAATHTIPPGARRVSVLQDAPDPTVPSARWVVHPAGAPVGVVLPPLTPITAPAAAVPYALSQPVPGLAFGLNTLAVGKSVSQWECEL